MPPPNFLSPLTSIWHLKLWWLSGGWGKIIWTVLYWQHATSSMGTVNKNSSHSPVGPWVCLCIFWVSWFICIFFRYVLFHLGQLSHFPSCFGAGVTNLNEPPSSFLLPPHYCGLGAGSIPFRVIANNKQCEMRGLFMSLVIHYWLGDVQDCQGVSASEMTYILSSGALNSTHSLTHSPNFLRGTILPLPLVSSLYVVLAKTNLGHLNHDCICSISCC